LRSLDLLDVLQVRLRRPRRRAPWIYGHLRRFASNSGEKSGLEAAERTISGRPRPSLPAAWGRATPGEVRGLTVSGTAPPASTLDEELRLPAPRGQAELPCHQPEQPAGADTSASEPPDLPWTSREDWAVPGGWYAVSVRRASRESGQVRRSAPNPSPRPRPRPEPESTSQLPLSPFTRPPSPAARPEYGPGWRGGGRRGAAEGRPLRRPGSR